MTTSPALGCAAKSSSFSQACNLLSHYLKEKRSNYGDLNLGVDADSSGADALGMPTNDAGRRTTMNLFPQEAGLGMGYFEEPTPTPDNSTSQAAAAPPLRQSTAAQMTILYGGQVIVFNDFPADKAKEIMDLANRGSATPPKNPAVDATIQMGPSTTKTTTTATATLQHGSNPSYVVDVVPSCSMKACDLPIARKASLHRFFEKRKDRIGARGPYTLTNNNSNKNNNIGGAQSKGNNDEAKSSSSPSWLGLAAQQPALEPRLQL